jgi:hypothetical protein
MTPEQLVLFGPSLSEHEGERRARLQLRRGLAAREEEVVRVPRRGMLNRPDRAIDEAVRAVERQRELDRQPPTVETPRAERRLLVLGRPAQRIKDMSRTEVEAFAHKIVAGMTKPRPRAPSS